jgi:excinuclease ABC subunit C
MINLTSLPQNPGCYIFKDKNNNIIYVGKAKDIRKRVLSYFSKKDHDPKTAALVNNIAEADFFITSNEIEALVLENNLIKKHMPRYNINLKDSKQYAYILVTDEEFPKLFTARNKDMKGTYYGPFTSAEIREEIIKILRNVFMIRTCRKLPKRECLRYHIKLCSAPCIGAISKEEYNAEVKKAEAYLKGNVDALISKLKQDMKISSDLMEYEKAKKYRDQVNALSYLGEKQRFELDKRFDEDIINYIISENKVYIIVFNVVKGMLATKQDFKLEYNEGFLDEFVKQFYSENSVPKEIILPHALDDESIEEYLAKLRKNKVIITIPKQGDKQQMLDLVKRNIEANFLAENQMINSLREELKLNSNPSVIECFDISNIQGTSSAGSMVQFRNAKPDKSNYRRFKIKTVIGSDDFASIAEVVRRRYLRLKNELQALPDLIVIDGGQGQLTAAINVLKDLELKIPIISLAKKFEEIYAPGMSHSIMLKKDSKALKLLIQVRNEAHRFAIKYHRLIRSKKMIE